MPTTLALVWQQVLTSFGVLRDRAARIGAGTALAMLLFSILSAPGATPGVWGWLGLLLVGTLETVAIVLLVASRQPSLSPDEELYRLTAAATSAVAGLLVNLTFGLWSTLLLVLTMALVARQATALRPGDPPWWLCATLMTLVPFWVWAALDAWTAALLLLVPLAALAFVAAGHLHDATQSGEADRRLSRRGHRLGGWLAMLLGGILVVAAGLILGAAHGWIALAGIAVAIFVGLEAGLPHADRRSGHQFAISDAAFVVLALCWLISLP